MTDKVISLIQLAIAAGKTVRGDGLLPAVSSKKAKLVILSSAAGQNLRKKILDKCAFYSVPVSELNEDEFDRISKKAMKAVAITDTGFARRILELRKDR